MHWVLFALLLGCGLWVYFYATVDVPSETADLRGFWCGAGTFTDHNEPVQRVHNVLVYDAVINCTGKDIIIVTDSTFSNVAFIDIPYHSTVWFYTTVLCGQMTFQRDGEPEPDILEIGGELVDRDTDQPLDCPPRSLDVRMKRCYKFDGLYLKQTRSRGGVINGRAYHYVDYDDFGKIGIRVGLDPSWTSRELVHDALSWNQSETDEESKQVTPDCMD